MNENSGLKTYFEINIGQFFKICFFLLISVIKLSRNIHAKEKAV